MDAYSSLLNLNFMASLRTGNVIADMMIAMLIPFLSRLIAHFFRELWPEWISRLCRVLERQSVETIIPANRDMHYTTSIDLDENQLLQEIIMNYVSATVRPTFEYGSYQYKRMIAATSNDVAGSKPALVDILRSSYAVQTVPMKDREVELNPTLKLCVLEGSGDAENRDGDGGKNNSGDGWNSDNGRGGQGKHAERMKLKQKKTTLVLRTEQGRFATEDAITAFATSAIDHYAKERSKVANQDRYLYQPLVSLPGGRLWNDTDDNDASDASLVTCQRYPLSGEKTFATLFFPEKERLIALINAFENRTGKFAIPGFPRKLVLLLYGPPGTGKTSLVKAIAERTRRHIFSIPLSRVRTNRQLLEYMFDTSFRIHNAPCRPYSSDRQVGKLEPDRVIYMLEDIDAASEVVRRKGGLMGPAAELAGGVAEMKGDHHTPAGDAEEHSEKAVGSDGAPTHRASSASELDTEAESESATAGSHEEPTSGEVEEREGEDGGGAAAARPAERYPLIRDDDSSEANSDAGEQEGKGSRVDKGGEGRSKRVTVNVERVNIASEKEDGFFQEKDKLSMKGVLNALGGILDAPGRIVIMTTNHIEHLDPALLRPGVVTMKLRMGNFDDRCGLAMVKHYFANQYVISDAEDAKTGPTCAAEPQWDVGLLEEVGRVMAEAKESSSGFSPAEVEQLCAENNTLEELLVALKRGTRREIF